MRLDEVFGALRGVQRFAVIGAVARNAWAPPRATTDLDLAVAADASVIARVESVLVELGYRCVRKTRTDPDESLPDLLVFRTSEPGLRQIDLLVAKTRFEAEVLARAVRVAVAGGEVPIATAEDVIVYKLIADRRRDRDDVRAVARSRAREACVLDWQYIIRWAKFWGIADRAEALQYELEHPAD